MMRRVVLAAVAAMVSAMGAAAAAAAPGRIQPAGGAGVVEVKAGRTISTYHLATKLKPVEFKVTGPVAVRVLSRYVFPGPPPPKAVAYGLKVDIDGVVLATAKEVAKASKKATLKDGRPIGTLEREVLRIPAGAHTVRITPVEAGANVAVRLFRGGGRKAKVKWTAVAPETFERAVRLHGRDSEVTYYRFSVGKPVALSLAGPARLKVITRLDFGPERGSAQTYAIKVTIDGKPAKSVQLKARASDTATYPELKEITPGAGRDVSFDVPGGRHAIAIALDGTTARSASLRILMPQQAVGNGGR